MRRSNDLKELRSVIGMWTYFTSFLPGYSIYAAPLFAQLRKDNRELIWNENCEKAWQTMKEKNALASHYRSCQSNTALIYAYGCM